MTQPTILPVLRGRVSPLAFDPTHPLTDEEVAQQLEAARCAPSAGNSQPWAFHVGRRSQPGHEALVARLAGSSARWAPEASALIVKIAHHEVEDSGMEFTEFADYDLGQAVAHVTIQAHAMGLACRQFRAFDVDGLTSDLPVAAGWQIRTMTAVGRPAAHDHFPARTRRPLSDLMPDTGRE